MNDHNQVYIASNLEVSSCDLGFCQPRCVNSIFLLFTKHVTNNRRKYACKADDCFNEFLNLAARYDQYY